MRATAVGFGTAISRFGMFWGVFFMPLILKNFGFAIGMYFNCGLYFIGFLLSYFMAPETLNVDLADTAAVKPRN